MGLPELAGRTNVNFKDKARNIKIMRMRNNEPLPLGFRGVTLSGADIRSLHEKYGVDAETYGYVEDWEDEEEAEEDEEEAEEDEEEEDEGAEGADETSHDE